MRLVDNARTAWKWFSIQLAAVGVAIQGLAASLPSVKDYLGDTTLHIIGGLILVSIIGARLIKQPSPPCPPDGKPNV